MMETTEAQDQALDALLPYVSDDTWHVAVLGRRTTPMGTGRYTVRVYGIERNADGWITDLTGDVAAALGVRTDQAGALKLTCSLPPTMHLTEWLTEALSAHTGTVQRVTLAVITDRFGRA